MSVNDITTLAGYSSYAAVKATAVDALSNGSAVDKSVEKIEESKSAEKSAANSGAGAAAVYEPRGAFAKLSVEDQKAVQETIDAVKEAQTRGLQNMVSRTMSQQIGIWQTQSGQSNSVFDLLNASNYSLSISEDQFGLNDVSWEQFTSGNFTVDEAAKKEAQEAISEDGYWGVKQTSDRIFKMAVALSGGDEEQMEKMTSAFEKGYEQATKAWGRELPEISKQTREAVLNRFDEYKKQAGINAT